MTRHGAVSLPFQFRHFRWRPNQMQTLASEGGQHEFNGNFIQHCAEITAEEKKTETAKVIKLCRLTNSQICLPQRCFNLVHNKRYVMASFAAES